MGTVVPPADLNSPESGGRRGASFAHNEFGGRPARHRSVAFRFFPQGYVRVGSDPKLHAAFGMSAIGARPSLRPFQRRSPTEPIADARLRIAAVASCPNADLELVEK